MAGDLGGEKARGGASEAEGRDAIGDFGPPRMAGRLPDATLPAGAAARFPVVVLRTGARRGVVVPAILVVPEAALGLVGLSGALPASLSSGLLVASTTPEERAVPVALLTSRCTSGFEVVVVVEVAVLVWASPGLSFFYRAHRY